MTKTSRLRLGLCVKIEQGSITFEQATDIFNRALDMVIQRAKSGGIGMFLNFDLPLTKV